MNWVDATGTGADGTSAAGAEAEAVDTVGTDAETGAFDSGAAGAGISDTTTAVGADTAFEATGSAAIDGSVTHATEQDKAIAAARDEEARPRRVVSAFVGVYRWSIERVLRWQLPELQ